MDWTSKLLMGNYTVEVWSAWALTLFCVVGLIIFAKVKNVKLKHRLRRQIQRETRLNS